MPTLNLGRVGFVNKGAWADGVHKINDTVTYNNGTYACILAHTSTAGDIIPTNTTYWQEWVSPDIVHKTGNETIAGIKTFSSSPIIPTPANGDNSTAGATTAFVASAIPYNINAATSKPSPIDGDLIGLVDSAASNVLKKVSIAELRTTLATSIPQDFRLTLTTGVPVTISGVTAATSIYLTPYIGNKLSIYNGIAWITYATAELSIAVPATTNTMYDIFVYSNAGTPTLELTAWTNDTTRATALVKQDGVYVKTGATTRRYLGSFRTTGVSGQTEDSTSKRYLWNYYNRVTRAMYITDATVSWAYTTASWRQANGNSANQIDFIIGVSEDLVIARATHALTNSGTAGVMFTGLGIDVTNANSAQLTTNGSTAGTAMLGTPTAEYKGLLQGRHFIAWLEWSTAVGTTTWSTNQTNVGIQGEILG